MEAASVLVKQRSMEALDKLRTYTVDTRRGSTLSSISGHASTVHSAKVTQSVQPHSLIKCSLAAAILSLSHRNACHHSKNFSSDVSLHPQIKKSNLNQHRAHQHHQQWSSHDGHCGQVRSGYYWQGKEWSHQEHQQWDSGNDGNSREKWVISSFSEQLQKWWWKWQDYFKNQILWKIIHSFNFQGPEPYHIQWRKRCRSMFSRMFSMMLSCYRAA